MEIEFESLHVFLLFATAVVIVIADHDGWRYLRGSMPTLSRSRVLFLHRLVWVGLLGMIATGVALIAEEPEVLEEPMFFVKLLMVAALVTNAVFIGRFSVIASERPFASLLWSEKARFLIMGGVSLGCWLGAAILGFVL